MFDSQLYHQWHHLQLPDASRKQPKPQTRNDKLYLKKKKKKPTWEIISLDQGEIKKEKKGWGEMIIEI